MLAFSLGCAQQSAQQPEPPPTEPTSGGEQGTRTDTPPLSYLPPGTTVIARVDFTRLRQSAIAADVSSAIRASETFQQLAGGSGLDPVQELDSMLIGADALYTDRRIVVMRHQRTDAEIRARVLALAVDRGASPEWQEVNGVAAIGWPLEPTAARVASAGLAATDPHPVTPYLLVITGAHELVLAPSDELPRIAEVARDHAARRGAELHRVVEPALNAMRPLELGTASMSTPPPGRAGYPEPPQSFRLVLDHDETGDLHVALDSQFATEQEASAAERWLMERIAFYAGQMMVRAMGMNRPLEEAQLAREGTRLDLRTRLTTEELRRVFGLLALSQMSASR